MKRADYHIAVKALRLARKLAYRASEAGRKIPLHRALARSSDPLGRGNWLAYCCVVSAIGRNDIIEWSFDPDRRGADMVAALDRAIGIARKYLGGEEHEPDLQAHH